MPSAWSESPPELAAEQGSSSGPGVISSRPTRASYVPPHLRNRPQGASPAIPDSLTRSSPPGPKSGSGLGVLGPSASPPTRQGGAWGSRELASTVHGGVTAWASSRGSASVPGSWSAGSAGAHGWGNGGGGSWGQSGTGRTGWGGGRDREVNPFADDGIPGETEMFQQENTGINFDAYEDIPVETSGENVPSPVSSFAEIDLGPALNDNIRRCKYVKPTPVQKHAIPISLAGRDLMACAQTGSGKTAAFCFPIIAGILRNTPPGRPRGGRKAHPLALILSPTRELSCQVFHHCSFSFPDTFLAYLAGHCDIAFRIDQCPLGTHRTWGTLVLFDGLGKTALSLPSQLLKSDELAVERS